jgi:ribose transport system substrate-binding protein
MDFVAIQAFGIGTLTAPVNKMIDAGIPVIDMDTLIAPLDSINVHSLLAPDNEFMGASVTQALVTAMGGKGNIVMTQGALGHTGAQGRARDSSPSSSSTRTSMCSTPSPLIGTSRKWRASGRPC